ncbi:hydrolase [Rhizobium rhizogenes]|uniref:Hydrolase (HAD superfamily) n=1 Tax=Rhizobium rhizogenes (strain K84 / ATCC BAA-868) TaxID=311403 RepID=B9JE98_RHIR8|nr:hydrolase (HAD superfamily) [Rhizobium rhizogenes K84]OCJ24021.1 hypothetical protein A6U88_27020 [Agrobacterium sp. B131/95]
MIENRPQNSLEDLRIAAGNPEIEVVSFDFFDTLFVRTVIEPEDVFHIIARKIGCPEFPARRREAQTRAFVTMHAEGRNEISLTDIYRELSIVGFKSSDVMDLELDLEKKVALPNYELLPFFMETITSGRKVIIVSDMYLPLDYFTAALEDFGIPPVDIFVSCELDATKRDTGELFRKIAGNLGISGKQILHVGDNLTSDVKRACEQGWQAFHYVSRVIPAVIESGAPMPLEYSISRGLSKRNIPEIAPDSYTAMGYHYAGPAAVAFYEWIKGRAIKDGVSHILLMARDGYIIDRVRQFDNNSINIPFSYFSGSRTVFSLASITENNFADCLPFLMSGSDGLSARDLLARINVPLPDARLLEDLGLGDGVVITHENTRQAEDFLWSLKWHILKTCRENRRGLFGLMSKLGLSADSKVAMVDIGWNGTTQAAFETAIGAILPLDVTGYYLALTDKNECVERRKKSSMSAMFDASAADASHAMSLYDNRVAVEFLFSAPHNSVVSLSWSDNGKVISHSDPRRSISSSEALHHAVDGVIRGAEKFASDIYNFTSTTGFKPDYQEFLTPLLNFTAEGAWKNEPLLDKIIDFDDWGMKSGRSIKLNSY